MKSGTGTMSIGRAMTFTVYGATDGFLTTPLMGGTPRSDRLWRTIEATVKAFLGAQAALVSKMPTMRDNTRPYRLRTISAGSGPGRYTVETWGGDQFIVVVEEVR